MNCFPIPIQTLIYRYVHRDALYIGLKEVLPINLYTGPYRMHSMFYGDANRGIEECTLFMSDMCKICYSLNNNGERSLSTWVRCCDILDGIGYFTIVNGEVRETIITHIDYSIRPTSHNETYKTRPLPKEARIDVTKGCLYSQLFHYYGWLLKNETSENIPFDKFVPVYERENE